jgi:hypothetical protein
MPDLVGLSTAGTTEPWEAAGFTVEDGGVRIGGVHLAIGGSPAWSLTDVGEGVVDGLATFEGRPPAGQPPDHPNGSVLIDHLVVTTPDLGRTVAALSQFGLAPRRTRDAGAMHQTFFRTGEVILEVVGPPEPAGHDPARFWGLAVTVDDLDATAVLLGEALGPVKDAVQPGRRIATVRHRDLGLPLSLAFMSGPPP